MLARRWLRVVAVVLFAQGCGAFQAREVDGIDDMSELLTAAGFPQFASPTFLGQLYETLGYSTVADLALIYEDALGSSDDFQELGIRQEDAATIAGQIAELDGVLAEFEEVRQEEREPAGQQRAARHAHRARELE